MRIGRRSADTRFLRMAAPHRFTDGMIPGGRPEVVKKLSIFGSVLFFPNGRPKRSKAEAESYAARQTAEGDGAPALAAVALVA